MAACCPAACSGWSSDTKVCQDCMQSALAAQANSCSLLRQCGSEAAPRRVSQVIECRQQPAAHLGQAQSCCIFSSFQSGLPPFAAGAGIWADGACGCPHLDDVGQQQRPEGVLQAAEGCRHDQRRRRLNCPGLHQAEGRRPGIWRGLLRRGGHHLWRRRAGACLQRPGWGGGPSRGRLVKRHSRTCLLERSAP